MQSDKITITGVTTEPDCGYTKPSISGLAGHNYSISGKSYDAEKQTFTVTVQHMGPIIVRINCKGAATDRQSDVLPAEKLELPKQPEPYKGPIIIEAEDMDRKSVDHRLTNSGWWAQDYKDFAGLGFIETQANTGSALRHQLKNLAEGGEYNIRVRYCNSSKAGKMKATVNGVAQEVSFEKVAKNDWHEAIIPVTGCRAEPLGRSSGTDHFPRRIYGTCRVQHGYRPHLGTQPQ